MTDSLPPSPQIVLESDINHDGLLDFQEFSQYLWAHEKRLWVMFHSVDRNNDGVGTPQWCTYSDTLNISFIQKFNVAFISTLNITFILTLDITFIVTLIILYFIYIFFKKNAEYCLQTGAVCSFL